MADCVPFGHPVLKGIVQRRKQIAEAAQHDLLIEPFKYLDIIDKFATRYGIHPDMVFSKTTFGTVTNFMTKWLREGEFADISGELEKSLGAPPQ